MDDIGTIIGGIVGTSVGAGTVNGDASGGVSALKPKPSSLYEFALALLVLWFVLEYVPGGEWIGLSILLVTFLSTPQAVSAVAGLLAFIQHPA